MGLKCYTCHKAGKEEEDDEFKNIPVEPLPVVACAEHEANCCLEPCSHGVECKKSTHYHRKKKALEGFKRREEEKKVTAQKKGAATHVRAKLCSFSKASECPDGNCHHHPLEAGVAVSPAAELENVIKEGMAEYVVEKEDQQEIGTVIYHQVAKIVPELAGKVTGMLLEQPLPVLDKYVEDPAEMRKIVEEAVALLQDYDPNMAMVELKREAAVSVVDTKILDKIEQFLLEHPEPVVPETPSVEKAWPNLGFTQAQRWARTSTTCGEFDGFINAMNILKTPPEGEPEIPFNGRLAIPCLQEKKKTLLGKSVIRDRLAAYPKWEAPASQQQQDVEVSPPKNPVTAPVEGAGKAAPAKSSLYCTSTVTLYFASDRGESRNPFTRIFSTALSYLPYVNVESQMMPLDPVGRAKVEDHTSTQRQGVKKGVTFGRVGNHNASFWLEQDKSSLYDVEYLNRYGYTTCERVVIYDDYYKFLMDDSKLVNVKVLTAKGVPREHVIGQLQNLSVAYKNLDEMNTRSRQMVQNTVMFAYQQKLVIETKSSQVVPRGVGGPPLNGR